MSPSTEPSVPGRSSAPFLVALALLTLVCFWPVSRLGFIGYDDLDYVYQNPVVQSGLNAGSLVWAFTTPSASNWHPLTWLSLMLDCQLFGLNPQADHLVNLGFHVAGTGLLFLLLQRMTGARWRSFFVAALFAIHPLHVQSVAWISERKDVLSGCFAMLTLLAYTRYTRDQKTAKYLLTLLLFALGLMAKPMLVTLPLVMLLLDFWPLRRAALSRPGLSAWRPLWVEKIPFLALCVASSALTFWAQKKGGSVVSLHHMDWSDRCLHAVVAYALYLGKLLWPVNLAIFYPFPHARLEVWTWLGALLLVGLPILAGWRWRRTCPWLLTGWLWFLITLLPVIGLVQVGLQSIADRYMYIPAIGLFVIAAWGLAELAGLPPEARPGETDHPPAGAPAPSLARPGAPRLSVAGLGAAILVACAVDTWHQLGFWRDNVTLFQHVVAVTPQNNDLGYFYLGLSYGEAGNLPAAADSLRAALRIQPDFPLARERLGNVLLVQKQYAAAAQYLGEVVQAHPHEAPARVSLGLALAGQRHYLAAQEQYAAASQLAPQYDPPRQLLAANAPKAGQEQTLAGLLKQLATNATPALHLQIAGLQNQLGDYPAAVTHYEAALAGDPNQPAALNNFAWLLATCPEAAVRNGPRAVQLAQHACELSGYQTTVYLGTLAAAQAEAGRFADAIATAQKACTNAAARRETDLLSANQSLLTLYQGHQAYHEPDPSAE
jgi:tetratricopeptide (TPR) repeat protein